MSFDSFGRAVDGLLKPSRRRSVQGLAAGGAIAGLGLWPKSSWAVQAQGLPNVLSGTEFDLTNGETRANFAGVPRPAITVTGSTPATVLDRKSVVSGTSEDVRVDPGGSRHTQKNINNK